MRGADVGLAYLALDMQETSPHAWSKPLQDSMLESGKRNISTCVEQTPVSLYMMDPA